MPNISSDQIRDISVKAVEQFLNNKVPLSEGIAKQASVLGLNSEQIKRSVEATNSIAYLKVLSLTDDRTAEFPLCKYAEVMANLVLPDTATEVVKSASVKEYTVSEEVHEFQLSQEELNIAFVKQAALNDAELERLKDRAITIVPALVKAASEIKKDPQALQKLAAAYDEDQFKIMSSLVFGSVKEHSNSGIFKKAELNQVLNLETLYKEAQSLQTAIKEKQALADRCQHIKQAGIMSGLGFGVGKALGSISAAPFKAVGKGIKTSVMNTVGKVDNFIKDKRGLPTKPLAPKLGIVGVGAAAATAGFDMTMYNPGTNKDTGTSKSVWSALQR